MDEALSFIERAHLFLRQARAEWETEREGEFLRALCDYEEIRDYCLKRGLDMETMELANEAVEQAKTKLRMFVDMPTYRIKLFNKCFPHALELAKSIITEDDATVRRAQ